MSTRVIPNTSLNTNHVKCEYKSRYNASTIYHKKVIQYNETIRALAAIICQYQWGTGPQMRGRGPWSDVRGGIGIVGGALSSDFRCIMGNGHMGTPSLWTDSLTDRQTDTYENMTFPCWNTVQNFSQFLGLLPDYRASHRTSYG